LLHNRGIRRRLRWLLSVSLLAIAITSLATALPTNWLRSAEVAGTIFPPPAHAWIVDDDGPAHFRKIQEAINAANLGDTIYVRSGTYREQLSVHKSLTLLGEEPRTTIIDGGGPELNRWAIRTISDYVNIVGFTLYNAYYGIFMDPYASGSWAIQHGHNISNNIITDNNGGIVMYSNESIISGNIVSNNYNGIYLSHSNKNTISNNVIARNEYWGIEGSEFSYENTIADNTISKNYHGIGVFHSRNNRIYHNNFIENTGWVQAYTLNSTDSWDGGYPSGGNYWSDYIGVDVRSGSGQDLLGSDGIGDTPHLIDADNQDRYPLVKPWSPRVESVITLSTEPTTVTVGSDVTISGLITPVKVNVDVTIYQRLVGEAPWNLLATVKTDYAGGYRYVWKPTQIGAHELKAIWLGDEITLPAESDIIVVNVVPIHDVAVVGVSPSATEVYVGWTVNITIVVRNEGNTTETFTVTCKYELGGVEHTIGTTRVTYLAPNTNTTLIITWKTTDVTVHTIKAEATILPNETDTTDNTMASPATVKVKILGDVNNDNKIDIKDIATAALAFGTYPGHPGWNSQADIDQDGKIYIKDLALIAKNFGTTYP